MCGKVEVSRMTWLLVVDVVTWHVCRTAACTSLAAGVSCGASSVYAVGKCCVAVVVVAAWV